MGVSPNTDRVGFSGDFQGVTKGVIWVFAGGKVEPTGIHYLIDAAASVWYDGKWRGMRPTDGPPADNDGD